MHSRLAKKNRFSSASLLALLLATAGGCQTWHSAAIPGVGSKKGEKEVMRQAMQDPFPSPSDVGMTATR